MDSHALDLTFLTETERKWIANVLNRDEALQKKEDERIARLKNKAARTNNSTIKKKIKLRSGEWFYDLVQPNKKSIKSGRETVRASIRVKSKDGQHRRPPLPPPGVLPQPDIIIEEQDITQPTANTTEAYTTNSYTEPAENDEPEAEEQLPYEPNNDSYNDRTSAYRISGYIDEEEENYSSDQNKGSTFANMHHAYVQEMPQSNDDYINDKPAETDLSTENDKHKDVVIPENYEYLQLTADEPEEETPEPVLKRAGSIRRKSTKRDKTQDAPPEIVFSSYDSTPDIQAEVENEQPQTDESNPFALMDDKESIETSSQQTSIISSDVVSDITDKHDDYVDDILEQSKDAHDISTDYSVSEPEVVNDVTVDDVIAEVATPIIEDEFKTELEDKVDELAGAMDFLQSMEDVREPKPDKKKRSQTNLRKGNAQSLPALTRSALSLGGSTWSVYSAAAHDQTGIEITGTIELGFTYSYKTGILNIHVGGCQNLASVDDKKLSNPYVKTYLLPDKHSKRKTKTKKRTLNPVYNEVLKYTVSETELSTRTLNVAVWHDKIGVNSFLGEVNLDCDHFDLAVPVKMKDYELASKDVDAMIGRSSYTGDVEVALRYVPSTEDSLHGTGDCRLEVVLKNVNNVALKGGPTSQIYVKGYFLPDKSQETKQKTPLANGGSQVGFDHQFVFTGVRKNELYNRSVELTVYQREKFGHKLIGGVRLGTGTGISFEKPVQWMDSRNEEVDLWQRMIQAPESWINGTVYLRKFVPWK